MDSLALKLMEDAADGPVDIDDDPDVDGWGDMHSDSEEENPDEAADESDFEQAIVNDDVSMDSDDDDNGAEEVHDEDDFMDADDSDDSDEGRHDEEFADEDDIQEDIPRDDDEDDSDRSDDEPPSRKKVRKIAALQTFVDADEYAEMMEKGIGLPMGEKLKAKTTPQQGAYSNPKLTKASNKKKRRSKY